MAERQAKPCLVVDLDSPPRLDVIRRWLARHARGTLNVAGPRESQRPGLGQQAEELLTRLLRAR
jgi:hypothetical protein